jgi:signal peptidase I
MLATATLKQLWRNEYFQTGVSVALVVIIVFGFWFGIQAALNTPYPALAVASGSMLPTLNVGDLIIVQGTPPQQINAQYMTGDIIVFRSPSRPEELIVHRAVRMELRDGVYWFYTHGDNNPSGEETFSQDYYIGKVVGRIPYVGNFSLFTHSMGNSYLLVVLIIIIAVIILMFPFTSGNENKPKEERKLFGKITLRMIYVLVLNGLLISIAVFSLIGALTFWQVGAQPPENVTIRGMYADIQFHESFKQSHNNITGILLSQGFLTYTINTINCVASDGIHEATRLGVTTFSWAQAAIVVLLVFDIWELSRFIRKRKRETVRNESLKPI